MSILWIDPYRTTTGGTGTYADAWSMRDVYDGVENNVNPGDEIRLKGKLDADIYEDLNGTYTTDLTNVNITHDNQDTLAANDVLYFPSILGGVYLRVHSASAGGFHASTSTWYLKYPPISGVWTDVKRVKKANLLTINNRYIGFMRNFTGTSTNPITITDGWTNQTTRNGKTIFVPAYSSVPYFHMHNCDYVTVDCPNTYAVYDRANRINILFQNNTFCTGVFGGYFFANSSSHDYLIRDSSDCQLQFKLFSPGGGTPSISNCQNCTINIDTIYSGYYSSIYLTGTNTGTTVNLTNQYGEFRFGTIFRMNSDAANLNILGTIKQTGPENINNYLGDFGGLPSLDVSQADLQLPFNYLTNVSMTTTYNPDDWLTRKNLSHLPPATIAKLRLTNCQRPGRFTDIQFNPADSSDDFSFTGGKPEISVLGFHIAGKTTEYTFGDSANYPAVVEEDITTFRTASPALKISQPLSTSVVYVEKMIEVTGEAGVTTFVSAYIRYNSDYLHATKPVVKLRGYTGQDENGALMIGEAAASESGAVDTWLPVSVGISPIVNGALQFVIAAHLHQNAVVWIDDIQVSTT